MYFYSCIMDARRSKVMRGTGAKASVQLVIIGFQRPYSFIIQYPFLRKPCISLNSSKPQSGILNITASSFGRRTELQYALQGLSSNFLLRNENNKRR